MRPLSYAMGGISSAHISTFPLTSAQANHVIRSERHPLCACLTFSTDICAGDPRSTAYIQYSLRMSRHCQRHVCRETSSCALEGISPAHISQGVRAWWDTEHEHVALISYWFTTRYKKPLFVVRILEWGLRTGAIYNTLISSNINKCRVRTP